MEIIRDEKGNATQWQAETEEEHAAFRYVHEHVPIFGACETYGIHAFMAGIEWARRQSDPYEQGGE